MKTPPPDNKADIFLVLLWVCSILAVFYIVADAVIRAYINKLAG